jgi:hypothetical protein
VKSLLDDAARQRLIHKTAMPTRDASPPTENQLGEVRTCDCGGVNLSMGSFTVHFSREEVAELRELVDAAEHLLATSGHTDKKARPKAHGTVH